MHLTTPDPEFECMCISVGLIHIFLYRNQEYSIKNFVSVEPYNELGLYFYTL